MSGGNKRERPLVTGLDVAAVGRLPADLWCDMAFADSHECRNQNEVINMNADPVCMREAKGPQFPETYTVGDDGAQVVSRRTRRDDEEVQPRFGELEIVRDTGGPVSRPSQPPTKPAIGQRVMDELARVELTG